MSPARGSGRRSWRPWGGTHRLKAMAPYDSAALLRRYGLEPDPVIEHFKLGVDRTRLREKLRRTVAERMELLLELQRLHEEARWAGEALRRPDDPPARDHGG